MKSLTHWLEPITRLNVSQTIRILHEAGLSRHAMMEGQEINIKEDTVISLSGLILGNTQYPYMFRGTTLVSEPDRANLKDLFYITKGRYVFSHGLLNAANQRQPKLSQQE